MQIFYQQMAEPSFKIENVGSNAGVGLESVLDIQYAPAIAKGASAVFWVEKDW
jgi:hypothetical protein